METKQSAEKTPPREEMDPELEVPPVEVADSTPPDGHGGPKTGYPTQGEE